MLIPVSRMPTTIPSPCVPLSEPVLVPSQMPTAFRNSGVVSVWI